MAPAAAAPLPLGANEWVTLYATFDRDTHAGRAAGVPYASGSRTAVVPGGAAGQALQADDRLSNVVYPGRDNLPGTAGTLRLFLKSAPGANLWNDGKEHWIAAAERDCPYPDPLTLPADYPGFHLLLYKSAENEIVFGLNNTAGKDLREKDGELPAHPPAVALRRGCAGLDPGAWHEVVLSWDAGRRRTWLRVGDSLQEGRIPEGFRAGAFRYLMLATHPNIYTKRQGLWLGLLDELLVSDRPLDRWLGRGAPTEARRAEAAPPAWPRSQANLFKDEPLATHEAHLRMFLDTLARQRNRTGGWTFSFHYPSGMHFLSSKVRAPIPDTWYNNSKDGTSTLAALRYAFAYRVLGEKAYLDVAVKAGESVLAAQQAGGWWPYSWAETPKGMVPLFSDGRAPIEDHTQTGPIFLMLMLHRVTNEARYLKAAEAGLDFLIRAQNPNGSWSHHYSLEKKAGESAIGRPNAGELNDYTTTGPMSAMLLAYRLTGQKRFLDAYLGGVNWIRDAFIEKGAVGWAQQYDEKNEPIWARHFEPPAVENFASSMAAGALMNAYRLTGDAAYLEPARKWVQWLAPKAPAYSFYHDIATGRPIVAEDRKVYFTDDPSQVAAHKAAVEATGTPYNPQTRDWVGIGSYVKQMAAIATEKPAPLERPAPDRRTVEAESQRLMGMLDGWTKSFHWEMGAWAGPTTAAVPGHMISASTTVRTVAMCWTLARHRALRGDIPLDDPLLRMPYELDATTLVAPELNLYARLAP